MVKSQPKKVVVGLRSALITALIAATLVVMPGVASAAGPTVFINEIHYDNTGADAGEAVEIAGPAGTDLTGWVLQPYNGSNGTTYATTGLSGTIPNQEAGFGTLSFAISGLQNGAPDGLALVDAGGSVVEFLSYEGSFAATNGPANGMTSTDIGVSEPGSTPVGDSLQLIGSGAMGGDFAWGVSQPETFGAVNTGQTFDGGGGAALLIDCGSDLVTAEETATSTTVSSSDADDTVVSMTLLSDDVSPNGSLTAGTFTASAAIGDSATLELNLDAFADAGAYTAKVEAENSAGDMTTCDVTIQVVAFVAIHDVQGPGLASPLVGDTVIIEGVVVGDFQDGVAGVSGDLNGFFVQEEDADVDADPLTSEGIFVFDGSNPAVDVAIGDVVSVLGEVSEFGGLTEITSFSGVSVLSSGNAAPTAASLSLPVANVDDFEASEGMAVTFSQNLVISEYFNFDRFGEVVLTSERHLTPTAEVEPGPGAIADAQANVLDRITLDDGRTSQNPDPAIHPNGDVFDLTNLFRGGDTVSDVTGVLNYAFGLYRVQPTQGAVYTSVNPRTSAPDAVGGRLQVATFNVLNYFTTLDDGADLCGPTGGLECRGADNADELTRQRDKIISALAAIDADVVGLIEIENNAADGPTADLVAGLNDVVGAGTYDYVVTGAIGTDAIRTALIYKPATVTPSGAFAVLDTSVDPLFDDTKNRPVLAQTFIENSTTSAFTIAVNHLKSKGSSCGSGDDATDGSGNCNGTRTDAATAMVNWLAGDPTSSGDPDYLIVGDLNSYDKEEPIDVITAAGYSDLVFDYLGEDAYSYVFDGQIGYLDYQLANESLATQVTGTTVWHINADEPDLLDYDTSFKQDAQDAIYAPDPYRSSDHDPVIIGLDLDTPMSLKHDTIDELSAVLPTGNNKDDKVIEKAIDRVDQSLTAAWWIDSTTLDAKGGKHVFDREHQAVQELQKVNTVDVQAAIDHLVEADRFLAQKQLDTAMANGGNAGDIEKAQGNMSDAAAHIANGDYAKAVLDYKKAWQNSVKAL